MSKIINLSYFSIYRNRGSRKRGAPSAPLTISGLTCKWLVGAPTYFFVHLQPPMGEINVHLGTANGLLITMKPRFLDKFSRELEHKAALYEQ